MKSKLLIYALPVLLVMFLLYGYSTQDNPNLDVAPHYSSDQSLNNNITPPVSDTATPAGFPYPKYWGWVYSGIPGINAGTVGACYFGGKYIENRWNSATLYRINPDGQNGGPGTVADSNNAYNVTGAIRDMTTAPDGSGRMYLWGGAAGTALYKMDSLGNRIATYTQAGAAYRTIAWDKNRKGFWSSNFSDNLVCRDTNGVVLKTIVNATPGKYGLGWDSTSVADSAFLWVWSQNFTNTADTTNDLVQINIGTGQISKIYNFNKGSNIAGGAEVFVQNNKLILSLNFQNYGVTGYVLKDLAPPPSGGTMTVCRNGVGLAIPDNTGNAGAVSDNLTISGIPSGQEIKRIKVTLQSLPHTWIGDVRVWITKGSVADTIVSRPGWTGTGFGNSCDNFTGTVLFDSTGLTTIQNVTPATCGTGLTANSTGNFAPKDALSLFQNAGIDPNGTYTIRVSDNAAGDTGTLMDWCVTVDYGTMTGINNNSALANDFKLSQNYPNPFNPSTTINYTIPKSGLVTLKVFDILGKEVASLVNGQISAGSHSVSFNASALSSGVYFYRIESGNFVDTKKMFLLK